MVEGKTTAELFKELEDCRLEMQKAFDVMNESKVDGKYDNAKIDEYVALCIKYKGIYVAFKKSEEEDSRELEEAKQALDEADSNYREKLGVYNENIRQQNDALKKEDV